jgi:hypothetical protein
MSWKGIKLSTTQQRNPELLLVGKGVIAHASGLFATTGGRLPLWNLAAPLPEGTCQT